MRKLKKTFGKSMLIALFEKKTNSKDFQLKFFDIIIISLYSFLQI